MDVGRWGPVLTLIGVVFTAVVGWLGNKAVSRASVQVQAISAEADQRRDTIADRDAIIARADKRERELIERVSALERRVEELAAVQDATRASAMIHAAWDWQTVELAREQGLVLVPPPPILPPHYRTD